MTALLLRGVGRERFLLLGDLLAVGLGELDQSLAKRGLALGDGVGDLFVAAEAAGDFVEIDHRHRRRLPGAASAFQPQPVKPMSASKATPAARHCARMSPLLELALESRGIAAAGCRPRDWAGRVGNETRR